jgi:hypothetical protein
MQPILLQLIYTPAIFYSYDGQETKYHSITSPGNMYERNMLLLPGFMIVGSANECSNEKTSTEFT